MGVRDYNFVNGPETPTLPTVTTPTDSTDFVTLAYVTSFFGSAGTTAVTGSIGSPTSVTAAGGVVAPTGYHHLAFVKGNSGAVDITANPQIAAGTTTGQELVLVGGSDTDTLLLENGTGLKMNGPYTLVLDSCITFIWDGTSWREKSRNFI